MAEDGQEVLQKLMDEHKKTPWATRAKKEKALALGLTWQPYSSKEADKDVPIRLTPEAQRKPPAVDLDGPAMAIPDPADPTRLPMPRKLDQLKPGSSQSWWRGPADKKELSAGK